jgi:hypothetical protein
MVTSQPPGESASIVCAVNPGVDQESVREHLANRRIVCTVRGGRIRFAPHLFNTVDEVEQVIASLPSRVGHHVPTNGCVPQSPFPTPPVFETRARATRWRPLSLCPGLIHVED